MCWLVSVKLLALALALSVIGAQVYRLKADEVSVDADTMKEVKMSADNKSCDKWPLQLPDSSFALGAPTFDGTHFYSAKGMNQ